MKNLSQNTVPGFQLGTAAAGLKESGKKDMAVVFSQTPCTAAGVFTQNLAAAAPVLVGRRLIRRKHSHGLVVNSGNANACTGDRGRTDAEKMSEMTAELTGISKGNFFPVSTGIIGEKLPMKIVESGIRECVDGLAPLDLIQLARAIMTTDTYPKTAFEEIKTRSGTISLGGAAKGSGMIAPNMATMLGFIFTDIAAPGNVLTDLLKSTCNLTFNCVTVDGDTSTNDTVLMFANDVSDIHLDDLSSEEAQAFRAALIRVCRSLCEQIAADGEGATKRVTISVEKTDTQKNALQAARAVAESNLVKTALAGCDPNWGRIVCALGYSGVSFRLEDITVSIQGTRVFANGKPAKFNRSSLEKKLAKDSVDIVIHLHTGRQEARIWTCDLTKDYVAINADYHT